MKAGARLRPAAGAHCVATRALEANISRADRVRASAWESGCLTSNPPFGSKRTVNYALRVSNQMPVCIQIPNRNTKIWQDLHLSPVLK